MEEYVPSCSFEALLLALSPDLAIGVPNHDIPRAAHPFSALRELTLRSLKMDSLIHEISPSAHLVSFLHRRTQQLRPIKAILDHCNINSDEAALLRTEGIRVMA